jgi:hypothetical protein
MILNLKKEDSFTDLSPPSLSLSAYLSIYLSVCLSVYLSVSNPETNKIGYGALTELPLL